MHLQPDQFRHAKPATIREFEHRAIAESARIFNVDRFDKMFDVEPRERAREFARMRAQFYCRRRIALEDLLVDQLARETAEAREMPALRAHGKTLVRERFEIRGQRGGIELRRLEAGIAAP